MFTAFAVIAAIVAIAALVVWLVSFEWLFLAVAGTSFFVWTMVCDMKRPHRRRSHR